MNESKSLPQGRAGIYIWVLGGSYLRRGTLVPELELGDK